MTARDIWVRPSTAQIVDALDDARELIRGGWTQHRAHAIIDGRAHFCVNGALAKACRTIRLTYPLMWGQRVEVPGEVVPGAWLRDAATGALLQAIPPRYGTIAAYNDQPARTHAEMIALFNTAIGIAKREVSVA